MRRWRRLLVIVVFVVVVVVGIGTVVVVVAVVVVGVSLVLVVVVVVAFVDVVAVVVVVVVVVCVVGVVVVVGPRSLRCLRTQPRNRNTCNPPFKVGNTLTKYPGWGVLLKPLATGKIANCLIMLRLWKILRWCRDSVLGRGCRQRIEIALKN